jgi:hypothetical protein
VSVGYLPGLWNDQDFFVAASRLEDETLKTPTSERRERSFQPQTTFPDLPDGIAGSGLTYNNDVWEGDNHLSNSLWASE